MGRVQERATLRSFFAIGRSRHHRRLRWLDNVTLRPTAPETTESGEPEVMIGPGIRCPGGIGFRRKSSGLSFDSFGDGFKMSRIRV